MGDRPETLLLGLGKIPDDAADAIQARFGKISAFGAREIQRSTPVILLVGPSSCVDDLVGAVATLQRASIPFGVVPWTSTESGLRWLDKVVEPRCIEIEASRVIFAYGEVPESGPLPGWPCFTVPSGSPSKPANLVPRAAWALWLSGHSNQVDGYFGRDLLLCGRRRSGEIPTHPTYPCAITGTCFREPADSPSQRVAPAELSCQFMVLSGCNTMPLGPIWHHPEQTLIDQLGRGEVQAVVCSLGLVTVSPEADLLMLGRLLDGKSIYSAVSAVNRHRGRSRRHWGLAEDASPLLVIGHPHTTIRFVGSRADAAGVRLNSDHLGRVTYEERTQNDTDFGRLRRGEQISVEYGRGRYLWSHSVNYTNNLPPDPPAAFEVGRAPGHIRPYISDALGQAINWVETLRWIRGIDPNHSHTAALDEMAFRLVAQALDDPAREIPLVAALRRAETDRRGPRNTFHSDPELLDADLGPCRGRPGVPAKLRLQGKTLSELAATPDPIGVTRDRKLRCLRSCDRSGPPRAYAALDNGTMVRSAIYPPQIWAAQHNVEYPRHRGLADILRCGAGHFPLQE